MVLKIWKLKNKLSGMPSPPKVLLKVKFLTYKKLRYYSFHFPIYQEVFLQGFTVWAGDRNDRGFADSYDGLPESLGHELLVRK